MKLKLFFFLLLLTLQVVVFAQSGFTPTHLPQVKSVLEVVPSPSGKYIAYTLSVMRDTKLSVGADYRELYIVEQSGGAITPVLTNEVSISQVSWLNEDTLTFVAKRKESPVPQVYKTDKKGSGTVKVTSSEYRVAEYEFSPNREVLYYVAEEPQNTNNLSKPKGYDAWVFEEEYPHLTLYSLNLKTGALEKITNNVSVFDFELSPNGETIAAQIAEKNLVDDSYMFKDIYSISTKNKTVTLWADVPGKIGDMEWLGDSKSLAFISAATVNDAHAGSIVVIDLGKSYTPKDLVNITPGFKGSATHLEWSGKELLFSADEGVYTSVRSLNIANKTSEVVLQGGEVVISSGIQLVNSTLFFSGETKLHPREVYSYGLQKKLVKRLTDNNQWLIDIQLAKQERVVYEARDGREIEGVLIWPLNYKTGNRYPLIVHIHGGPEACEKDGWQSTYGKWGQMAAAEGFFVFYPNYRASTGRGVDYVMEGFGDPVGKEFEDVIDGIDYLVNLGFVNKQKVGIGGGSYGGYFANWGATKYTHRFAAAVSFVGISNTFSKALTTDIPQEDYLVHWGIYPHDNPDKYMEKSPIAYVKGAKTPLLLLHGEDDPRVPTSQSYEMYRALKVHGAAPVRFVLYPGEGHGNSKNTNKLDYAIRTLEWFKYYLKDLGPKDKMPPLSIQW